MEKNNEDLIDELYDKLTWYTFQASEDDFDKDSVKSILLLLNKIDPLPVENQKFNSSDHLNSFPPEISLDARDVRQKLGLEEKSSENDPKIFLYSPLSSETILHKRRRRNYTTQIKIAVLAIVIIGTSTYLSLSTIADRKKSFFEILRDGPNSMKITVTGSEGDEHKKYYSSWDLLSPQYPTILPPKYIPSNLELKELYTQANDSYFLYSATYTDNLSIKIYSLYDLFDDSIVESDWKLKNAEGNVLIFDRHDEYLALFVNEGHIYTIIWDNLDEIIKISNSMQK